VKQRLTTGQHYHRKAVFLSGDYRGCSFYNCTVVFPLYPNTRMVMEGCTFAAVIWAKRDPRFPRGWRRMRGLPFELAA